MKTYKLRLNECFRYKVIVNLKEKCLINRRFYKQIRLHTLLGNVEIHDASTKIKDFPLLIS